MAYWLLKTEPDAYGWDELKKKGAKGDAWTGVRNFTARRHLQAMKTGDRAFFYHTGEEKQVVGIAEVIRESYPDSTDETGKFVCVDVKAVEALPRPVTLAAMKSNGRLKDMVLVQQPRLSVQPVTEAQWRIVCALGGL
jgi:predicted RNA-binding protein with PUA-like domain